MCIALISTAHPDYALIVLDNRDEYLSRPTSPASHWPPPYTNVIGGRDLLRDERGTWLGLTTQGQFAVLTNFREVNFLGGRSRGGMVNAFLKAYIDPAEDAEEATREFVRDLLDPEGEGGGIKGVGGFSLVCGVIRPKKAGERAVAPLAVVSNRTPHLGDVTWIARERNSVYGLSNSAFDHPYPKVVRGKKLLSEAVEKNVAQDAGDEERLIRRLLEDVLSSDTMPPRKRGEKLEVYMEQLRHSVFIPAIGDAVDQPKDGKGGEEIPADTIATGDAEVVEMEKDAGLGMSGLYGTQKQTVILVDWEGKATFVERTLWDEKSRPVEKGKGDRRFEFEIEGWQKR